MVGVLKLNHSVLESLHYTACSNELHTTTPYCRFSWSLWPDALTTRSPIATSGASSSDPFFFSILGFGLSMARRNGSRCNEKGHLRQLCDRNRSFPRPNPLKRPTTIQNVERFKPKVPRESWAFHSSEKLRREEAMPSWQTAQKA